MFKFTKKEKEIVRQLNLGSSYTVESCEEWMNRRKEDIQINTPAALQQLSIENFVDVVRQIAKVGIKRTNEEYTITDSVRVGDAEYVLAELTAPGSQQMYVTWECATGKPDAYYRGEYSTDRTAALRSLLARVTEKMQRMQPEDITVKYPELAKYDAEDHQYDMDRPDDDTPVEDLMRCEIVFDVGNKRYYCFADALTMDEALGQFSRQHPHITYDMIVEHLEV